MLRGLGRLSRLGPSPPGEGGDGGDDDTKDADAAGPPSADDGKEDAAAAAAATPTYIATIGPTTRDYLQRTFGYEPDVCAETPSPEGVWKGITRFMASKADVRGEKGPVATSL